MVQTLIGRGGGGAFQLILVVITKVWERITCTQQKYVCISERLSVCVCVGVCMWVCVCVCRCCMCVCECVFVCVLCAIHKCPNPKKEGSMWQLPLPVTRLRSLSFLFVVGLNI